MNKQLLLAALSFIVFSTQAQNVGIGTNDPKSKLDIQGNISLREGSALALSNGNNDNIALTGNFSFYRITGPTAAFSINGIVPVSGADGQLVTLVNTTTQILTIKNEAVSSTAANRFTVAGGSDLVSVAGGSSVTIQYNKTTSRWYVTASQNFTVTTGAIATGDLTTSNTAITLTNNTGRLVGTANMTVNVADNALGQKGLVIGPTNLNANQAYLTDNSGNPTWAKIPNTHLNNSSVTINTGTGLSGGGTVALGGTLNLVNTDPDQSVTNEAQTLAGSGTNDINLTQAGGAGGGTITLQGTGATTVSRSGNTFTINSTNSGGTVTNVTASNGLNSTGGATPDIKLGGTLSTATNVALNGNNLTFSGTGNVGVGSAPSAKLDVDGSMRIRGGSPATGMVLTATDANGNAAWKDIDKTGIVYSGSVTAGNWYRIASNVGNRANAEFTLRDYISSGGHSTMKFIAGTSYNDAGGVSFTMLNHSKYNLVTFLKVRILQATTYDPQYIEVYVNRTGSVDFSIKDNQQANGWVPISWTAGAIPSGYSSREFDVDNIFTVGDYDDRLTVARGGNVGLGTPTPQGTLDVTSTSSNPMFLRSTTGESDITYDVPSGSWQVGANASGNGTGGNQFYMYENGGNYRLTIQKGTGNVGIGTTNPGFRLHVPSGYIGTDYINTTDNVVSSGVTGIVVKQGNDYHRTATAAAVLSFLGVTAPTGDNLGNHTATTYLQMGGQWINFNGGGLYSTSLGNYFWPVDQYYWNMRSDRGMHVYNNAGTSMGYLYHDNSSSFGLLSQDGNWKVRLTNSDVVLTPTTYALVNTNYGQLQIGAQNASWCHFQTDRASFYFNPKVTVDGNVEPYTNNARSLGTSALRWNNAYFANININGVTITAPSANYTLTLPATQGGAQSILVNDGSGNLSWGTTASPWVYMGNAGSNLYAICAGGSAGTDYEWGVTYNNNSPILRVTCNGWNGGNRVCTYPPYPTGDYEPFTWGGACWIWGCNTSTDDACTNAGTALHMYYYQDSYGKYYMGGGNGCTMPGVYRRKL